MTVKRFTLVLALLALLTAAASAHDAPAPKGFAVFGHWFSGPEALLYDPLVLEATGLDDEALSAALQEGSSINELIAANDGDAEGVIAELAAQAAEAIQSQAAVAIDGLEAAFEDALEESHRRRFPWRRRPNPIRQLFGAGGMDETIMTATGLDKTALNDALRDGATIAELIAANEGDVDSVLATLVGQATAGINETASARVQRYEEMVADAFDTDFSDASSQRRKPRGRGFFGFWHHHDSPQPATDESDGG